MINILSHLCQIRTYKHLAYLVGQLPIGILYFTILLTGLSAAGGLAISVVGLPFAAVVFITTLYVARQLWNAERWLLDQTYHEKHIFLEPLGGKGLLDSLRALVVSRSSWIALLTGLLRLPIGLVVFTILVVSQATFVALILSPFYYGEGLLQVGGSPLLTSPLTVVIAVIVGVVGIVASSYIIRFVGDGLMRFLLEPASENQDS